MLKEICAASWGQATTKLSFFIDAASHSHYTDNLALPLVEQTTPTFMSQILQDKNNSKMKITVPITVTKEQHYLFISISFKEKRKKFNIQKI